MNQGFVCYSHADRVFSDRLAADLRAAGVSIWRDVDDLPGDLPPGSEGWRRAVEGALDDCAYMVLVLSPDAVAGGEVEAQWRRFLGRSGLIYLALHRDCEIPALLQTRHPWDFRYDYERALVGLIDALPAQRLFRLAAEPDVEAAEETRPEREPAQVVHRRPATVEQLFREGVAAIRAGDKQTGREKLTQVVERDQLHEEAWMWLGDAVEERDERIVCLENALTINPRNEAVRRRLEALGVETEPPVTPEPEAPPPAPPEPAAAQVSAPRLRHRNPLDHARLLWLMLMQPGKLAHTRRAVGAEALGRTVTWLAGSLLWFPLLMPAVALVAGTLPSPGPAGLSWVLLGVVVLGWAFSGWLGDHNAVGVAFILAGSAATGIACLLVAGGLVGTAVFMALAFLAGSSVGASMAGLKAGRAAALIAGGVADVLAIGGLYVAARSTQQAIADVAAPAIVMIPAGFLAALMTAVVIFGLAFAVIGVFMAVGGFVVGAILEEDVHVGVSPLGAMVLAALVMVQGVLAWACFVGG